MDLAPAASSAGTHSPFSRTAFCCRLLKATAPPTSCAIKPPRRSPKPAPWWGKSSVWARAPARLALNLPCHTLASVLTSSAQQRRRALAPMAARTWSQRAGLRTRTGVWSQPPGEGMEPQLPRAGLSCPRPRRVPSPGLIGAPRPDDSDLGACPSGPWFSSCDPSADAGFAGGFPASMVRGSPQGCTR